MKLNDISQKLLLIVVFLSGLGLVQVYSSSYIFAIENFDNGLLFFKKQFIFTIIGLIGLLVFSFLSWSQTRIIGITLWFLSVVGLILTLVPELSVKVGGAGRWIQMPGGLRVQPSEWFKITSPFAFVYFMALKEKWPLHNYHYWIVSIFSFTLPILILILQPDFGAVVLILCLIFSIFFIMGLKWRYVFSSLFLIMGAFYFLIINQPYRLARVQSFLDPWADATGSGFQVIQSLLSFHSGGFFGQGLGQGQGKLFFLPEAHTDFTFSVLGEELGFVGFNFLLIIYGCLAYYGMKIVFRTEDLSRKIVAFSLVFLFIISTLIHMGVNLGLLPPTGLVLPFLSYGGNALICTLLGFGWLIQIENSNH